jgi:diguanylate cyclase (GGDEF)-like protein
LNTTAHNSTKQGFEPTSDDKVIGSILEQRVQHLALYMFVVGLLWAFSSSYVYYKRGIDIAIYPYGVMTTLFLLAAIMKLRLVPRSVGVNLFLFTNYIGLLFISAISQYRESTLEFHFSLLCLMAVQMLGMKAAVRWFTLTIGAIFLSLYSPLTSPDQIVLGVALDHLVSAVALAATVLLVSAASESSYIKTTTRMQKLADRDREISRMLKLAEETASVGYWHWNVKTGETTFSDELLRVCELPDTVQIEQLTDKFDSPGKEEFQESLRSASESPFSFAVDLSFAMGDSKRHVTCRGFSERGTSGSIETVFGVIRDETELRETAQRLSKKANELNQLACVDTLTGLSNRLWFHDQLEALIENAACENEPIALLVLDMDGFKEINDTLGHSVGDLVLVETANRIKKWVGTGDVVSRLGGDEFTIILRNPESVAQVEALAQQIVTSIRKPMEFEKTKMQVGASVGVSICPHDAKTAGELFTFADTAMYHAKFNSKDVSVYQTSMTAELIERKKIEAQLSDAADRGEFSLVYQPLYLARNQSIVGFEALIRWNRDGQLVSPAEFIPVLETSGKIIEVGHWILDQTCQQLAQWKRAGIETRVAVNISPVQFRDPSFYDRVVEVLARNEIEARFLDLEITEGAIISDVHHTVETLQKLKALGCMISIDDFGTGYSSLAYLKNFPIDLLKIDRAFIKDIPEHDDGMIASSIVVLGLSLGMNVLAEGVETKEQLDFLMRHDCDYFQGFYGSKPISPEQCLQLLLDQEKDSSVECLPS